MEMEEFPLQDIAPILMEMINDTMTSKKKPDESESAGDEIFTVESYLSCCKETGAHIDDLTHFIGNGSGLSNRLCEFAY